jgi:lipopolysaccharide cholinephosphotransferase
MYLLVALCLAFCGPQPAVLELENACATDLVLPRIDAHISAQFYQMLKAVDAVLTKHAITYWLTQGSLLGAVRHQGIIPWDDDIDLAFYEKDIAAIIRLRSELKEQGYELLVNQDYMKIFPINGKAIVKEDGSEFEWKYPFIDLFPMRLYEDKISYASERLYAAFSKNDWFYEEDIASLEPAHFGTLEVPIPNHASDYLERVYGKEVWNTAYMDYNHVEEKKLDRIPVQLITKECAPH